MAIAPVIPHADASPGWHALLEEIVASLHDPRAGGRPRAAPGGPRPGDPVIVAGAAVPPSLPSARHDVVILAPSPFDAVPRRFPRNPGGLRVLAFTSACHLAAQRAGLPSAFFQYYPDPARWQASADPVPHPGPGPHPHAEPFTIDTIRAMALGRCVRVEGSAIAGDYVVDRVNGLVGGAVIPCSPDAMRALGAAARLSVAHGFARWQADRSRLAAFILSPRRCIAGHRWAHGSPVRRPRTAAPAAPALTVATVVRNAAADLRHTLESVCSQRYAGFEVVVLDGASTDGTPDVIREFAGCIDHWNSAPDEGPYDAMQKAAGVARGGWILFMNAGDRFVDHDALGRLADGIRDDPDFVAGHHVHVGCDGIEMVNHCAAFETTHARLVAGDLDSDWVRGTPCHQAVLTRTELLRRHRFDPSFRIAADHEFMYRMRSLGASFRVVPTIVAEYAAGGLSARQEFLCLEEWRRIAHAHSRDVRRADRRLDRMLAMAMKAARRRGPFDFASEPARSRPRLAAAIDLRHRLKQVFRMARRPPGGCP